MPNLSIIIVSYNNWELLDKCLKTIQAEAEIIVVDNASSDLTVSNLRAQYPQITLIANPTNTGFAHANNQGLKIAQGQFMLLLNNDTEIIGDALTKMLKYLQENPNIGLLGPKLLNLDGTIQAQGSSLGPHFWNSKIPTKTSFLRGAALMFPRHIMDSVGLLDEGFFFYNEDLDFAWRIKKAGFQVIYYPEAEIMHIGGKTTFRKQLLGMQGTWYLWKKWYLKLTSNPEKV